MLEVSNISLYENPTVAELARELLLYRMQEYSERCVRRGYPMRSLAGGCGFPALVLVAGDCFRQSIGERLRPVESQL